MKIILIGPAHPLRGGIAHHTGQLYKKLIQRGHKVKIISFKRQYPSIFFPGKTQHDLSKDAEALPSELILDSIGPISWLRVFLRIYRFQPDFIAFSYWMPFFAPCYGSISFLTRLFTKTKILFICHNIVPHESSPLDRFLTRLALWNVHFFIVMSKTVQKSLLNFKPNAVYRETPHPVYDHFKADLDGKTARRRLNLSPEENVLLFFGYVRKYKGLHTLIEAMPFILKKIKVKLLVAGEFYDDRKKYTDRIEQLKIEKSVLLFDEYIPNEKVGDFFAAADVVVLPYISATQSGIIQIAYRYNKPVITTDVGGLPEVTVDGKTGYIVPAQNPQALAAAVVRFFSDENGKKFEKFIAEYKKKFSWERLVEEVEGFFRN